jgi:rhamnopyranosyl-N-acetylglucosaminyl-diphospho-decaprenol beta-1,3/1,4-galactofuranosyltransferase
MSSEPLPLSRLDRSASELASNEPDVVAVVVTYNRATLLQVCLTALLAQTAPLRILVIDNASTDETPALLKTFGSAIEVVRLQTNSGGAGGFHEGLRLAELSGADLVWLMDDDTIARPDSLEHLLAARVSLEDAAFYCSRVLWSDGRPHPMNLPALDDRHDRALAAATAGCVAVRSCSFVSVLFETSAVRRHGLPIADYFIWGDDVEYTLRMTAAGLGVLVPDSVVEHRTTYFSLTNPGARYYFAARNNLWTIRFSPGARGRQGKMLYRYIFLLAYQLKNAKDLALPLAALRGIRDGLLSRPGLHDTLGNRGRA